MMLNLLEDMVGADLYATYALLHSKEDGDV